MAQRRRVSNTLTYMIIQQETYRSAGRWRSPGDRCLMRREKQRKARHMSIGYVTFLMGALIACAFCLVNYIQMQSELTTKITEVSRMESELNSLKLSNDESTAGLPAISIWKKSRELPSANLE